MTSALIHNYNCLIGSYYMYIL